jgi:hypothetical protein
MSRISRRSALSILAAPACGVIPQALSQTAVVGEATPTRERVSLSGVWHWQPAPHADPAIPADGWTGQPVPAPWPGPATAAWYQRSIAIPGAWAGRRITLSVGYLNSYAVAYMDGVRAGELRYPSGELDLTAFCRPGATHTLSLLVEALPLKAVMLSYSDTASARQVPGQVQRRGLCGDVYLTGMPAGPRIADARVETSVRQWRITLDVAIEGIAALDETAPYRLHAQIADASRTVKEFTSAPFHFRDLAASRIRIAELWQPAQVWDTHTPENQYRVALTLLDSSGRTLDAALPETFGFRELWIDGRDFYLNGSRIFLSSTPLDSAQGDPTTASYQATRATLQRFKTFGVNFVYTHNYGCEPGTHLSFEEVLRAADDEGVLVAFSQPHFGQYDWTAPDADRTNGYRTHAAFYTHVARNHPSVVFYSTSHNSTGYSEDMNPDLIDGATNRRDTWALRNAQRAQRAEALIRELDPSRIVYHHSSGNLGAMHTVNFYGNFIPAQEMSDWFEHWATTGVKPLFTCEYSVPFLWDWAMYRGWYQGKREFGSAVVPWEFHVAEWDAQFLGARAYRISPEEAANLRWEAGQFRKGAVWHRWDYPYNLGSAVFEDRLRIMAAQVTENWRAFRTWGLSANGLPWDIENYWKHPSPGVSQPTPVADALYRNNRPLLGYIAGKPAAFTSRDHNARPGQTVEKQLIAINNSRLPVAGNWQWRLNLPKPIAGTAGIAVPPGGQQRTPLKLTLPAGLPPGRYDLHAALTFTTGETQEDSFAIDVLSPRPQPKTHVALFDPPGETARTLSASGLAFTPVDAAADISQYDTLIVGKSALSLHGPAPEISRVRDGLKVVVFEQTGDVLERRFGFRIAEYGLRQVFPRIPDHPLLSGLDEHHLRDWRGAATILPARLKYEPGAQFNLAPTVKWAGIPVTRVWRAGNRGNVASALIEKPACGDFLPILDGGYGLQYTPLVEYREGRGMVLFCQMDVNGRTEPDPAAEDLVRNILTYVATWKPPARRAVVYSGEPAGLNYLRSMGIPAAESAADQLLVVGPGGEIKPGGPVLALGLGQGPVQEYISTYFEPYPIDSPFAGISPADVHNRDPRPLPTPVLGATGNVVFSQLVPWHFDHTAGKMNIKRTFRNVARLTARLLGNLGAQSHTPLLGHFSSPVADAETRWLSGLYLDIPEEWDDPYRFFRW